MGVKMKRRLLVLGTATIMALSLIGCGSEKEKALSSINPDKYVTLGDYKGLTVSLDSVEVTEEEIQDKIDTALKNNAEKKEITDRPIQKGDIVNIDYVGTKDGKAFEGGTSAEGGYELTIGSNSFIEGFEEGLIGSKIGDTVELPLTFPEDYHSEDLKGQDVVFTVSVNSISEETVPQLSDEVAAKIDKECKTVAEYKEKVKQDLISSKKQSAQSSLNTKIFELACSNATVKNTPEWLVENKIVSYRESAELFAKNYNMEFADFLSAMGQTEEQFTETSKTYAATAADQALITYAIAKAEKLTLTDEELQDAITLYTTNGGYETEEKFKEETDMESFEEYLVKNKVLEMLVENAKLQDADGNAVDQSYFGADTTK
ncbi:MAG: trigger factor [Lachnospiraceae bacterium]|nr:trigger factor [Lachnospiraceae bacterium]